MSNVTQMFVTDEITGMRIPNRRPAKEFIVMNAEGKACAIFETNVLAAQYLFDVLEYNGWVEEIG